MIFLNLSSQILLVQKQGVKGISRLTFSEIDKVEPHSDLCFIMAVKGNADKLVTCANKLEAQYWVRCLTVIS